ncbi:MAG: site-2 protease family protein [Acidimicrobiales bacterium]|nr:site-2 protease family protein [Acidimicrobiales bacterium]
MGRDIPLGRIAGIKVTMDVTVLLLAAFYTVALAVNRFPIESPGHSDTTYWIAGVGGALLFFLSLLVHELGHALVARDEGIGVRGISLWLLGGVAKLESSPTTARSEFRIAVVGPLSSLACGIVLLCGAYALPDFGTAALVGNLFALLGRINLLLAAFNLIPAAPLDGGTVLSSMIWKRTGSQATGMKWAAWAGIVVGASMIWWGWGWVSDGDTAAINGWSLILVGAFILFAAFRSLKAQPLVALLDGVTVAEGMVLHPPVARTFDSVGTFLRSLDPSETAQAYPVIDDRGHASGLLTASAIRATDSNLWEKLPVQALAFPLDRVTVVRSDEPLLPAAQRVDGGDIRDGLVVSPDGEVIGTIDSRSVYRVAERRRLTAPTAR